MEITPNEHLELAEHYAERATDNGLKLNWETAQIQATLSQAHATMALAKIQQLANRMNGGSK